MMIIGRKRRIIKVNCLLIEFDCRLVNSWVSFARYEYVP